MKIKESFKSRSLYKIINVVSVLLISCSSTTSVEELTEMEESAEEESTEIEKPVDADFYGKWSGTFKREETGLVNEPRSTTLTFSLDGSYVESSQSVYGRTYPHTNMWEYIAESNFIRFTWLQSVYAGHRTYSGSTFKVTYLSANRLELIYLDENETYPQHGHFVLER